MHPHVIWAIARKDFMDIWHNRATFGGLVGPIILALIWLLIGNLVGSSKTMLLVYNPGNSSIVQVVEQAFPDAMVVEAGSAAQVQSAFGPNGASVASNYTAGLVVPENFDQSLSSGTVPSLSLYLNGNTVGTQAEALLQSAIINYARAIASPQPPVTIDTTLINPPSTQNAGVILKQIYAPMALAISLVVGITFIPMLLLEEKEKKTLRMLLVSPASFIDILVGKLLVVLVFQLAITCVVLEILGSFTGDIPLILLYALVGACFSLSTGLLLGSLINSMQSANTLSGFIAIIFTLGGIFVGQLGELLGNSPILKIVRFIPTYYLADGVINASQNIGTLGSNLLDISILLAGTVVFLAISIWALRRQSAVLAII
jgi:ABC-2 type transport system permease protein